MQSSERTKRSPTLSSEGRADLATLKIDRTRTATRRSFMWLWALVLLIAVVAGAIASPQLLRAWNGVEVSVATATLSSNSGSVGSGGAATSSAAELSAAGYVVADRQSTLASKSTGRLVKLNVSESQRVKKDEVVAEVDHHELDALTLQQKAEYAEAVADAERLAKMALQSEMELASAKAPLATLDAQVREMKITQADAQRRLILDKAMAEANALPSSQVDDRRTEVNMAQAKIDTAQQLKQELQNKIAVAEAQTAATRAAVVVAEAHARSLAERIKVSNAELEDCFVFSPYDGVVTEKMAEVGEIVAPISIGGSMAKGAIVTVADWNSLQAEVDVAEAYIAQVKPGGRATITVDAFPDKAYPGRVARILPHANRTKATVEVRVEFLKRDDTVLPDMGLRVKFIPEDAPAGAEAGLVKPKIVVPRTAVLGTPGKQEVWVVAETQAKRRIVETGEIIGDTIEIKSGLAAGEIVVTLGADKLSEDNQKVKY